MKIRSSGLIESYNFAVDNSVSGEIVERFSDLRESFVEILAVPRVQGSFAIRFDSDGAVAVEFNFFCGVRRYVALRMRG